MFSVGLYSINTSHRRQSKTIMLSTNVDLRLLEIEFLIAVCRQTVIFFLVALVSDCFCYVFSRPILNKHFRERQSKMSNISTNVDPGSLKQSFCLPFAARLATNGNQKHSFQQSVIHVHRLLRGF